jgi:copper(I)-binding protein
LKISRLLAISIGLLASGTGLSMAQAELAEGSPLAIEDAWVRAMPPGQHSTAAYMAVTNRGHTALNITGAAAELAQSAEIHISREIDGFMTMAPVENLALAPGEIVQLSPGGMHLMLMGLASMPTEGSTVRLCLESSTGQSACVDAPVQRGAAGGGAQGHQHHH